MGITILRPGTRLVVPGVRVIQPSMASVASWWLAGGISVANCVAAYAPKGAADLASSYINLANPGTYNAAPGLAPTFATATGWTFNGSSQYLTTGIVPASGWSIFARFSNVTQSGTRALFGSRTSSSSNQFYILVYIGNLIRFAYGNGQLESVSAVSSGVLGIAGGLCYLNSANVGDGSAGVFAGSPPAIYLGASNNAGSVGFALAGNLLAVAVYNATLTSGQVAALTTAMNNL